MLSKWAVRKRAQRSLPTLDGQKCEACGTPNNLQRHHPDYSEPDRFEVLCAPCHVAADKRDGHRASKAPIACKVCGVNFLPKHSKKHTTCSRECLAEIGRRNALKRWAPNGVTANGLTRHE